jgi:hypothetical protein
MRPTLALIFSILIFSPGVSLADGEEPKILGSQIFLNDILFQPQARISEPSKGGVDPLLWLVGVKTQFVSWVDVRGSIGSSSLLGRPSWSPQPTESVSLIEMKGTLHSFIGDIYAGQTLVPWGLEGQTLESQLWLPRSLLYENGVFPLRDIGAGFKTESDGFYMNIMVHNGEGGGLSNNQDNRMFFTGQWGYMGPVHTNFGVSATAGHIGLPYAQTSTKVRGGNMFFGFNIFGLGLQLEGSYVQTITDAATSDNFSVHSDIEHPISNHFNFIGRWEEQNPNTRATSNVQSRVYGGLEFHSVDNFSRLFLFAVKNYENITEIPNDEIRLIWRIAPVLD